MPDHRLRLRALLSQPRIARFAAAAVLCTLLLQLLIRRIRAWAQPEGVTFSSPACDEAANLPGIVTALGTRHGLIGSFDTDGQFEIDSFGILLTAPHEGHADACAGYRIARADPLARRLAGQGPGAWAGQR